MEDKPDQDGEKHGRAATGSPSHADCRQGAKRDASHARRSNADGEAAAGENQQPRRTPCVYNRNERVERRCTGRTGVELDDGVARRAVAVQHPRLCKPSEGGWQQTALEDARGRGVRLLAKAYSGHQARSTEASHSGSQRTSQTPGTWQISAKEPSTHPTAGARASRRGRSRRRRPACRTHRGPAYCDGQRSHNEMRMRTENGRVSQRGSASPG